MARKDREEILRQVNKYFLIATAVGLLVALLVCLAIWWYAIGRSDDPVRGAKRIWWMVITFVVAFLLSRSASRFVFRRLVYRSSLFPSESDSTDSARQVGNSAEDWPPEEHDSQPDQSSEEEPRDHEDR